MINKQTSQKFRHPGAGTSAFYAHLMPKEKDQLMLATGQNKVTYDKALGGKIQFQPIPIKSPNSPLQVSEDSEVNFPNVPSYNQNVLLPQLVPQVLLSSLQNSQSKFSSTNQKRRVPESQNV